MTFVCFVTLSVNTFLKLFLFFQIFTFPSGDSDKSDKRVQSQKRQGFQTGDKRKLAVTKGGGVGNGQAFVTTGFSELLSCIALVARLSDFCHFCHCHRRESRVLGWGAASVMRECTTLNSLQVLFLLVYSLHLFCCITLRVAGGTVRKSASFNEAGALSSTVC